MKNAHWLGRLLLMGFAWIFIFGASYVLLDSLGVWGRLPVALTRSLDLVTGVLLAVELIGHLALSAGGANSLPS